MSEAALDLVSLEKVDLHRHLEGCIRPSTALELHQAAGSLPASMTLAEFEAKAVINRPVSLIEALDRFDLFRDPIDGWEHVVRIVREAVEDGAAERITRMDLRFSPVTLARCSGLSMEDTFRAVAEGLQRAREEHPEVIVEPLAVASRRRGVDAGWKVLRGVEAHGMDFVVGFDLASDEMRHKTSEFAEVARAAHGLGLPLTVHTGEGVPPSNIADTLELPGVKRLGHAVALIQDAGLVREVAARGITVEVCPSSNLLAQVVPSLKEHPAHRLLEAGVRLSISSDDPLLFGITLTGELELAREVLGFTDDEIQQCEAWGKEAFFVK